MSYVKQNFVSGQKLKAEDMNRIEDAIAELESSVAELEFDRENIVAEVIAALPVYGGEVEGE